MSYYTDPTAIKGNERPFEEPVIPIGGYNPAASVQCQVCRNLLVLGTRVNSRVVKCNLCGEATPIKPALPGKKYVRCSCRCLMICSSSSVTIKCPRQNCGLVVNLSSSGMSGASISAVNQTQFPPINQGPSQPPPYYGPYGGVIQQRPRVNLMCGSCGSFFHMNVAAVTKLPFRMRCPTCKRVNIRSRIICVIFTVLSLIIFGIALGITLGTYEAAAQSNGIYVIWTGGFVLSLVLFIRGLVYLCMPVAVIQNNQPNNIPTNSPVV